jgi:hypothetical protein
MMPFSNEVWCSDGVGIEAEYQYFTRAWGMTVPPRNAHIAVYDQLIDERDELCGEDIPTNLMKTSHDKRIFL